MGDVSFRVAMDRLSLCLFGDFIILWECSPPILEEDLLNLSFFEFLEWVGTQPATISQPSQPCTRSGVAHHFVACASFDSKN